MKPIPFRTPAILSCTAQKCDNKLIDQNMQANPCANCKSVRIIFIDLNEKTLAELLPGIKVISKRK